MFFPVLALVFAGCSMGADFPQKDSEPVLRLLINSFPETARTISPDFGTGPDFQKYFIMIYGQGSTTNNYNLTFTGSDRNNPKLTSVAYGTYTITVWGYLSADDSTSNYSAEGIADFTFNSSNTTAMITLSPVSDTGTGTLKFRLSDLSGTINSATLIDYSDIDNYPDIEPVPELDYPYSLSANTGVFSTKILPTGFYALYFGHNVPEIVHIYRNFETVVDLEIDTPEKVSTPTANPFDTNVTLSCATAGASIYYTTNGDTPTLWSTVYSDPIEITTNPITIKAFAVKPGMLDSEILIFVFDPQVE